MRTLTLLILIAGLTAPAYAQQSVIPALNGSCPQGSAAIGNGYCQGRSAAYVPSASGSCPRGFTSAGNGYCREQPPAFTSGCPYGTHPLPFGGCRP